MILRFKAFFYFNAQLELVFPDDVPLPFKIKVHILWRERLSLRLRIFQVQRQPLLLVSGVISDLGLSSVPVLVIDGDATTGSVRFCMFEK
ncbi:hypothetical protein J6590_101512 [Homalodisca vitripennis]|nr:hypothetical protein J6590_101512 [Homalodisca vitripennis]